MRKEGLEPSRCYPQVPETCASTSSATFAGRGSIAGECGSVKETCPQVALGLWFRKFAAPAAKRPPSAASHPRTPAAHLPVPPLAGTEVVPAESERVKDSCVQRWRLLLGREFGRPFSRAGPKLRRASRGGLGRLCQSQIACGEDAVPRNPPFGV